MGTLAQKRLSGESDWAVQRTQSFKAALKASMNVGTTGSRVYDGVDQRHGIAYNMPWGTDDFTMECWFKAAAPSGSQFIISFGGSSASTAGALFQLSNSTMYFRIADGTTAPDIYVLGVIETGKWTHMVASYTRSTGFASAWINGVAVDPWDMSAATGSMTQTNARSAIGGYRYDNAGYTFNGSISRARIALGYAYTAADALESYNKGNGKFQAELSAALASKITHSWNMNEGSGDLIDSVGGLDLAEYGTDSTISPAAGPREATAADLIGGNHGTLIGFADTVNCWKADTPDGSYSAIKADSVGSNDATMTGFSDVDAAHVDGPEGHWGPYIEDQGGAGNDGWLQGALKDSRSALTPDELGVEYSLLGDGTRAVRVEDDSSLDGIGAMTIEGWVYHDGVGNTYLLSKRTSTGSGWGLYVSSTESVVFYHGETAVACQSGVSAVTANTWTHIAGTWNGTQGKVWVNGVDVTSSDNCADISTLNSFPVWIGARDDGSGNPATQMAPGARIARVSLHDVALTEAQLLQLAAGNHAGAPIGTWEFDQTISLPYIAGAKALRCDGIDDYLDGGDPNEGLDPITAMCWVRKDTAPTSSEYFFAHYDSGSQRKWGLRFTASLGTIAVYTSYDGVAATQLLWNSVDLCDGQWHHIAFVFDYTGSGEAHLYIDGNVIDTASPSADLHDTTANVTIGSTTGASYYHGDVADPRIYSGALSQNQVRSIISGVDVTGSLVAEWPFNDSPRSIASCADGYSLEVNGGPYVDCRDVLPAETDDMDMGAWIKTTADDPALRGIIAKGISGVTGIYCLRVYSGKAMAVVQFAGGTAKSVTSDTDVSDGAWHHLWMSIDRDGYLRLYVDGVEEGTAANISGDAALDTDHGNASLLIGDYQISSGDPFIGLIDDVRVSKGANYSASDIATLAAGGEPATSPTSRWSLDDGPQHGEPSIGDPICVWETCLGERLAFTQEEASNRPTYEEDADGHPYLAVDGTQFLAYAGKLLQAGAGAVLVVGFNNGSAANSYVFTMSDEASSDTYLLMGHGTSEEMRVVQRNDSDTADAQVGPTTGLTGVHVLGWLSDGSVYYLDLDGQEELAAAGEGDWGADTGIVNEIDNTVIGARKYTMVSNGWDGGVYEVYVWDGPAELSDFRKQASKLVSQYM